MSGITWSDTCLRRGSKNYVYRYKTDKALLEKHPEQRELLEKRIARHEKDIVAYVTSEHFENALNNLHL